MGVVIHEENGGEVLGSSSAHENGEFWRGMDIVGEVGG